MTRGWVAAAIAIVVWGVTFASTRVLLEEFSALEINIARFALAWVALACAAKVPRGGLDSTPCHSRQIRRVKWYNTGVANETLVNSLVFGSGTGGTCVCAACRVVAGRV